MPESNERKIALITGSGIRLGKDIAIHLAKKGYDIALHYHSSVDEANQTANEIRSLNQKCQLFPLDFSRSQNYVEYIKLIQQSMGPLCLLVNNASLYAGMCISDVSQDMFDKMFSVNLKAPFFLSQAFYQCCQKGNIINLIDNKIHFNQNQYSHYLLTKKALAEFTKMAALEFSPDIRVNGVAPGVVLPAGTRTKEYIDWRIQEIPVGFQGNPNDVLQGLDYILESKFVTGQILTIDGGESINMTGKNFSSFKES